MTNPTVMRRIFNLLLHSWLSCSRIKISILNLILRCLRWTFWKLETNRWKETKKSNNSFWEEIIYRKIRGLINFKKSWSLLVAVWLKTWFNSNLSMKGEFFCKEFVSNFKREINCYWKVMKAWGENLIKSAKIIFPIKKRISSF